MFERYTERARRVIFFARYEASQFGSPYIEAEHILLGILREDKALTHRFLHSRGSMESIRKQIEAHSPVRETIVTSVDLPLSNDSKRVLAYAAEEAERLAHQHIGAEHLFLGLLREESCFAAELLRGQGVQAVAVREGLVERTQEKAQTGSSLNAAASEMFRDLTQAATDGLFEPIVGRDLELDGIIEILCSNGRRNPILIGQRGVGKAAIVQGLAQRIVNGLVPSDLANKRILEVEPELFASWATGKHRLSSIRIPIK